MPDMIDDATGETKRDGKAGYILFTPRDSLAAAMTNQPNQVMIEYDYGHMRVGMGDAYTVRMLANDHCTLTQGTWEMYPKAGYRRLVDGTIIHNFTTDRNEFQGLLAVDHLIEPPPKILEEHGRRTEICSVVDQGKLLRYWAWTQQELEVGIGVPDNYVLEYWMNVTLQPVPGDDEPFTYHRELQAIWLERLRDTVPMVAQKLGAAGDFVTKMIYLYNRLRIWFVPKVNFQGGMTRVLAEDLVSKDK
jgi:hypothetical protein